MTLQIGNTEAAQPRSKLLTTEDACIHLWGEYSRKMKVRLYRAYKKQKIGSVVITGRHYWRLEDLNALMTDVRMAPETVS